MFEGFSVFIVQAFQNRQFFIGLSIRKIELVPRHTLNIYSKDYNLFMIMADRRITYML